MHWLNLERSGVRLQSITCLSVRAPSGVCTGVELEVQIPRGAFEDIYI
jgi:hypothetical protein